MRELQDIVAAWDDLSRLGRRAVLATVVKVEGSAFRGVGARMLVSEDGRTWGGVSGGCLEGDVIRRVPAVLETGRPETVCYDTRSDADIFLGFGLGCNGVIRVLLEPVSPGCAGESSGGSKALNYLWKFLAERRPVVLVTVIRTGDEAIVGVGHHAMVTDGVPERGTAGSDLDDSTDGAMSGLAALRLALRSHAGDVLGEGRTGVRMVRAGSFEVEAAFEYLSPPLALIVFGAGNDAVPLVKMAETVGWRVTVMDYREGWATPERFPLADDWLHGTVDELLPNLPLDGRTGVVLMSHNYLHDRELLPRLLDSPAGYIGVLGSSQRIERLLRDVERRGVHCANDPRLRAPVGLDIGARTPEEIALAVLAEMQAVFAGKNAGFMSAGRAGGHGAPLIVRHSFECSGLENLREKGSY